MGYFMIGKTRPLRPSRNGNGFPNQLIHMAVIIEKMHDGSVQKVEGMAYFPSISLSEAEMFRRRG